jgi:hypothetical protein
MPTINSFFVNSKNVIKSYRVNTDRKELLKRLSDENRRLDRKLDFYKSKEGQKSLIKEKLHRVEEGEVIIKLED